MYSEVGVSKALRFLFRISFSYSSFSIMQFCLVAIIALFFLSSCGKKDPAKEFIGKWNIVGDSTKGLVLQEDGTGFSFEPPRPSAPPGDFTWKLIEGSGGSFVEVSSVRTSWGGWINKLRIDGNYLKNASGNFSRQFKLERAK